MTNVYTVRCVATQIAKFSRYNVSDIKDISKSSNGFQNDWSLKLRGTHNHFWYTLQ